MNDEALIKFCFDIFDIDQGDKATINEIRFIGDKKFKDRKLRSVIISE